VPNFFGLFDVGPQSFIWCKPIFVLLLMAEIYIISLKFTSTKIIYKAASEFPCWLSFSVNVRFSPVAVTVSETTFGTIWSYCWSLQPIRNKLPEEGSGYIFRIGTVHGRRYHGAIENLIFNFLNFLHKNQNRFRKP
jgi:hypothetical protein